MRHIDLAQLDRLILDSILSLCSIKELFSRVYDNIHLPLNYFDTAFRLIANSFPRPFPYQPWEAMAENLGASNEDIVSKNYLVSQERMYLAGKTILFNDEMNDLKQFPQACGPVISNGILFGYMGTMVEDAYPEDVIAVNDRMIQAIIILSTASGRNRSLADLRLEGFLSQKVFSSEDIAVFEKRYPPPYIVACAHSLKPATSTMHYINFLVSQTSDHIMSAVNSEDTVYILQHTLTDDTKTLLSEILKPITNQFPINCGISDRFTSFSELRKGIHQADLAITSGLLTDPEKAVFSFAEYYEEILSLHILESASNTCFHPGLKKLIAQDRESSDRYIDTLRTYLKQQGKISSVAEELHIHKNTVAQRLHKIELLSGFQTEDINCADALEIQLQLYDVAQKIRNRSDVL